jgi:hypothetical protein
MDYFVLDWAHGTQSLASLVAVEAAVKSRKEKDMKGKRHQHGVIEAWKSHLEI